MYLDLLHDPRFYDHLLMMDQDLADKARRAGCLECSGRLDSARFRRKPRGGPAGLSPEHLQQLGLCCDRCRRRLTPPSVRFLPHRVYYGAVLVLAGAQKLTARWVQQLEEELGVDRRTLRRWRSWWQEHFARSPFWQAKKGAFQPPVIEAELPGSLLDRFSGGEQDRLVRSLSWLAPLRTFPLSVGI